MTKNTPSPIGGEGVLHIIRPPAKFVGGLIVSNNLL